MERNDILEIFSAGERSNTYLHLVSLETITTSSSKKEYSEDSIWQHKKIGPQRNNINSLDIVLENLLELFFKVITDLICYLEH